MKITYRTIDGFRMSRSFKTIKGARAFAHKYVGEAPEIGSRYAVSADGIGKITVEGVSFRDLFPAQFVGIDTPQMEQQFTSGDLK
jgi:hypothetical protein